MYSKINEPHTVGKMISDYAAVHNVYIANTKTRVATNGQLIQETAQITSGTNERVYDIQTLRPAGFYSIANKNTFAKMLKMPNGRNDYFIAGHLDVIDKNHIIINGGNLIIAEGESMTYSQKVANVIKNNKMLHLIANGNGRFYKTAISGTDVILALSDICKIINDMAKDVDAKFAELATQLAASTASLSTYIDAHVHTGVQGGAGTSGAPSVPTPVLSISSLPAPITGVALTPTRGTEAMTVQPQLPVTLIDGNHKNWNPVK